MPRNKTKFRNDIKDLFANAMTKSTKASFEASISENTPLSSIVAIVSSETANAFASEMQKLADIIDDYLDSAELDLTAVMASGSPVSGKGKIKPAV